MKTHPMISLDDELAMEYLAECREHLATIETDLLTLEQGGVQIDEELAGRIFRAAHAIKGGAAFFDLIKVRELAHGTQDVMEQIRSRKMVPTSERVSVLLRATDTLDEMIQNPAASNKFDIVEVVAALAGLSAHHQAPPTQSSVSAIDGAQLAGEPLRALLVEDDFGSRLLLQTFLSRYGECHIAVNGREAVEAFGSALDQGKRYDLICMDIMMPEMDGREAVRQVRALEMARGILSTNGAKIIMTTAVTDIKEVIRCFRELCDSYLMKPIDLDQLLSQMKSFHLVQ